MSETLEALREIAIDELKSIEFEHGDTNVKPVCDYIQTLESRLAAMERAIRGHCWSCANGTPIAGDFLGIDCSHKIEGRTNCDGNHYKFAEPRFAEPTGNKMLPVEEDECDEIAVPSTAKPAPSIERQFEIKDAEIERLRHLLENGGAFADREALAEESREVEAQRDALVELARNTIGCEVCPVGCKPYSRGECRAALLAWAAQQTAKAGEGKC
jgi:hypothetical protein